MADSIEVVRRHKAAGTLMDDRKKIAAEVLRDLADVGYWGLLVDPKYGGSGAPFCGVAPFLTWMATVDATVAGLASVHGCIGAVDPVRTFGTDEQKARLSRPASRRSRLSAFALTEPCAGSDLTGPADPRRAGRRRLRRERREAVHHERHQRRPDRCGPRLPDRGEARRPDRGLCRTTRMNNTSSLPSTASTRSSTRSTTASVSRTSASPARTGSCRTGATA